MEFHFWTFWCVGNKSNTRILRFIFPYDVVFYFYLFFFKHVVASHLYDTKLRLLPLLGAVPKPLYFLPHICGCILRYTFVLSVGSCRAVGDRTRNGLELVGLRLLLFFSPSLVVMLGRTWHIAGLYVMLCFVGQAVCSGRVAAYWKG